MAKVSENNAQEVINKIAEIQTRKVVIGDKQN